MIKVESLKKYFPIKDGFFNNKTGDVKAVENVSFEIPKVKFLVLLVSLDLEKVRSEEL